MISGGAMLAESLATHSVERLFCVAGESYLPVLDALLDTPSIRVVTCRHESGASFMAEAYANLTGKPGIAFVTRGPGACNASIGIHTARQSSTPVLLFVGLINTADTGREAFQEFDLPQMFGSLSKKAFVITNTESIPRAVARAFHESLSGRPGPVVIGLPEDILFGKGERESAQPLRVEKTLPRKQDIAALRDMLSAAQRPVVIAGGGGWSDEDCANLSDWLSACHLPAASAFRRQDILDHAHACYIGELGTGPNPALVRRIQEADTVFVLGERPDEITMQSYALFKEGQKLIHAFPSGEAFGKAFAPDLAMECHPAPLVAALAAEGRIDGPRWAAWREEARADYLAWSEIKEESPAPQWNGADMTQIFRQLREFLPQDAVVTTDAGNFSGWCQRYLRYGRPGRLLAPVSGAMGYGIPAAVAAALEYPDRTVLGVCGDGGFLMTAQELATAAHHGAKPVIMVCNNGMYGTIRMHQERTYPGRISATSLTNPDFIKLGESYGAFAVRVERAEDFGEAWKAAINSKKTALIEIRMDARQVSTRSLP